MALDLDAVRRTMKEVVLERGPEYRYARAGAGVRTLGCFYVPLTVLDGMVKAGAPFQLPADSRKFQDLLEQAPTNDPRWDSPCLIGEVLGRLGETRQQVSTCTSMTVEDLHKTFPDMFGNSVTVDYLTFAQDYQDDGGTWDGAYKAAERWLHHYRPTYFTSS